MMEARVKEMLHRRKSYEGERNILTVCVRDLQNGETSERSIRINQLNRWIAIIDGWMMLLTEDEAFVVKRHLIDGIDWPRVTLEYERLWGQSFAKAERTLRSYQQNALAKIVQFIADHTDMLN